MYPTGKKTNSWFLFLVLCFAVVSCGLFRTTYNITEETVKATYKLSKFTVKTAYGAGKVIYHVGGFTFEVVSAPFAT